MTKYNLYDNNDYKYNNEKSCISSNQTQGSNNIYKTDKSIFIEK